MMLVNKKLNGKQAWEDMAKGQRPSCERTDFLVNSGFPWRRAVHCTSRNMAGVGMKTNSPGVSHHTDTQQQQGMRTQSCQWVEGRKT
jgi:hypothetical protein